MIFPAREVMGEKERGRLCTIQMNGSDSLPFIIKKDKLLIGRADSCEIRMYIIGVAPEHCIITFNKEGRGFIEPVNKCGLLYLNGDLIERQVSLEHNDVITVVKRSFRFFYPTSSKFYVASPAAESCEMNMVEGQLDFEPEDALTRKEREAERRVTFGPRLSPEEFDRNMPPASPLRKGSLPGSKLKAKTSVSNSDSVKSHIRRNLFRSNQSADSISYEEFSEEHEIHQSTVVLHQLNDRDCEHIQDAVCKESDKAQSRPLFSDVLKKQTTNPPKNVVNKGLKRYSPKRLKKKTIKLKDPKRTFYKSPRRPVNPQLLAVSSTGHANSPETIIICKKKINRRSGGSFTSSAVKRKSLRSFQGNLRASTSSEDCAPQAFDQNIAEIDFHQDNLDSNYNRPETLHEERENIPQFETPNQPSTSKQNLRKSKDDDPTKKTSDYISPRKSIGTENDVLSSEETENAALATEHSENIAFANERTENAALTRESYTSPRENIESNNTNRERGNETPRNQNDNTNESSASPLAAVIDNVAHMDGNNIDKSLKDIHNAVLALSYPQSSVGSEPSGDMCINAVKKLALTISMVNAFHMYNRIIDDVSNIPFCLPSTSFDASKSNVNSFQNSVPHQNKEISEFARASWFQDIMHNFFSSTNCNEYDSGRRINSQENEPGPSNFTPTSLYSRKSKKSSYMSKGKVPLRAIDSGSRTIRKSKSPQNSARWIINDDSEMIQSDSSKECHECGASIEPSFPEVSPESSIANRERSHARTSKHSTSFGRGSHIHHSTQNLEDSSSHDLSLSNSVHGKRKSSVTRGSISNPTDNEIEPFQNNSVKPNKQFRYIYKVNNGLKSSQVLARMKGPAKSTYTKLLRSRNPVAIKRKRVSFVAKKLNIRAAKKLKEQRKETKHIRNVLSKVRQRKIMPPKNLTVKALKVSPDLTVHSNQTEEQAIVQEVKNNRVSQKLLRHAKSIKSKPASENLNIKSVVSPKLLRRKYKKRKSILLNRKGLRNRKSITSQRKISIAKDVSIDLSLLEATNDAEEQKIELEKCDNKDEGKKVPKKRGKQVEKSVAVSKGRKRKSVKITDSAVVNDGEKSQVAKKKAVRKYRKRSSDNKNIAANAEKGLPSPKLKTRRGRKKVNESVIEPNMSHTESLNSEMILEEKNGLNYEKEEHRQENSTESQLLESKSPQIKAKSRRGRRKKVNENIVSDISCPESEILKINLEENNDHLEYKESQQVEKSPKVKLIKRRKNARGAKKQQDSNSGNFENVVLVEEMETDPIFVLPESENSGVKTTRGRKKVKTTNNSAENLQINGSDDVVEQPKKRGRRCKKSNLTPKISRKTRQNVTKTRKSIELETASETSRVTIEKSTSDEDLLSEQVESTPIRAERTRSAVSIVQIIEPGSKKNKRPYKKRETKRKKKTDIETITIEENLLPERSEVSIITPQLKRGRKRILTEESEVAVITPQLKQGRKKILAEESEVSMITPQLKRGRKKILSEESEGSITKPQVKRGRKRLPATEQDVALNEEGTEQNQTKRKKIDISDVNENSIEHSTDVALTENEVSSDKKKSQKEITKSKPQQGTSKSRLKKTEKKASPQQITTRTLRSRK